MRKLKLLMATLAMIVGGVNCAWAYQTPVADGVYYLYNTGVTDGGSGFISRGEDYGKRAVIGQYGIPIQLISTGETDTYYFQLYDTKGWLSDDGFMYTDGGLDGQSEDRRRAIKVELQSDGNYKLLNTNNNKEVENWYGHPVGDGTGNRRDYLWQFLSAAEYEAIVAGYTTTQNMAVASSMGWDLPEQTTASFLNTLSDNYIAIDKTSLIQHASFGTDHSTEGWTFTANASCAFSIGWGNEGGDKTTPEIYTDNNKSIAGTISQTVTVEKAGLYKVSVNAFYRSANYAALHEAGCSGSVAFLQANNNKVRIGDIYYSLDNTTTLPSGPNNANSKFFANGKYLNEVYVYVPENAKTIAISLNMPSYNGTGWFVFNNFKLTYYTDEVSDADATAILATVDALLEKEMDTTIKSNLTSARNTFNDTRTIANYNALNALIPDAQASVDAYALFDLERTKALALGMTSEAVAALAPDVNALKVAEYNYVTTNYAYGVSLGTWTTTGETATNHGQHWDGTTTSTYLEQLNRSGDNPAGWHASSWEVGYSQNVELPAGNYVFKVAGRRSSNAVDLSLVVKNGNDVLGTVNDFPMGDTGKGIDTSGATNFGDGTYANNGNGRGFEWRYVKFTLSNPATVNVAVSAIATASAQWMSFCNPTVQTDDEDNVELMEALVALNDAKIAANLTKNTTNVGTGVFQLNEDTNNSLWSAYETAKQKADDYTLTSASTPEEVNGLVAALNTAISNYQNQPLNAPDASKHYNIIVTKDGHAKNGNAIVIDRVAEYPVTSNNYVTNNTGFTLNASATPNANLAQACMFTPVSGKVNTYYISMERTEGTVYLTYGLLNDSKVNWKDDQIQATTEASKKGEFKIAPTSTANVFNIINTITNSSIDCQDGGNIYTENKNTGFSLAEASQATVNVSIGETVKYGTRIFPFTPSLSGVAFYSCEASEGNLLTLSEVSEPAANTPYILYAENGLESPDLTGWGTAAAETYTTGWLTGVYTATTAPVGSYVLQKNNDKVGFYKVVDGEEPTVGANRCYLSKSSEARVAFFFDDETTTAIEAIDALTSGNVEFFNAAGTKVPALQKGMNIIKKADGTSYKVMVK